MESEAESSKLEPKVLPCTHRMQQNCAETILGPTNQTSPQHIMGLILIRLAVRLVAKRCCIMPAILLLTARFQSSLPEALKRFYKCLSVSLSRFTYPCFKQGVVLGPLLVPLLELKSLKKSTDTKQLEPWLRLKGEVRMEDDRQKGESQGSFRTWKELWTV